MISWYSKIFMFGLFCHLMYIVYNPLVQMCSVSASRLNTTDMATYMINCIYLIQNNLALYEFTDTRLEMLQAQVLVFTNNYYHYLHVVMRALINI
jgi:hypothetical protein